MGETAFFEQFFRSEVEYVFVEVSLPSRSENRKLRKSTDGEPPALIKNIIWMRDNWGRYQIPIAIGTVILVGGIVVSGFEMFLKFREAKPQSTVSAGTGVPGGAPSTTPENSVISGNLSDDDAMTAIEKALSDGDAAESVRLLSLMKAGTVKANECEHLYGYAQKHQRWEEGRRIVELCWEGEDRQSKLEEILHESLKK